MAYACPVCQELVPDGEHLAHHVAITAMSRGGEHEVWLEETVPDWLDYEPEELGSELVEHVEAVEHDLVDDPRATAHEHDHAGHGQEHGGLEHADHEHGVPDAGGLDPDLQGERAARGPGASDADRHPIADEPTIFGGDERPGAGERRGAGARPSGGPERPRGSPSITDVEAPFGGASADVSPETAEILEEARAMTEGRGSSDDAEETSDAGDGDDTGSDQGDGSTDDEGTAETDTDE